MALGKFRGFGNFTKEEVAGFLMRRYDSLLQSEIQWFNDINRDRLQSLLPVLELTKKVAEDRGITVEKAFGLIENFDDKDNDDVIFMAKYIGDLKRIEANAYTDEDFKVDLVTMFIQSRVPQSFIRNNVEEFEQYFQIVLKPDRTQKEEKLRELALNMEEWVRENLGHKAASQMSDALEMKLILSQADEVEEGDRITWKREHTLRLPAKMIEEIIDFINRERNGGKPPQEVEAEEGDELGKSLTQSN